MKGMLKLYVNTFFFFFFTLGFRSVISRLYEELRASNSIYFILVFFLHSSLLCCNLSYSNLFHSSGRNQVDYDEDLDDELDDRYLRPKIW